MRLSPLLALLLLAACATAPVPTQPPASAPPASMQWYQDAAAEGKTVWAIDSKASLIAVTVRRGGPMARLGHDHVVASRSVEGMVAPDAGRAQFRFRLDQLRVDDSDLRQEAGLTTAPSEEAIEGTRTNMLTRVLNAERHPVVEMSVEPAPASSNGSTTVLRLRIRLNGTERSVEVPTEIRRSPGGLVATGSLTLLQTDFGITPMSVLGGAITVQDQMELRFRLVAGKP
jgi:hypothetical protein